MSFNIFLYKVFCIYKMSKDSSAKCYQSNKEKLQTKEKERYQEFSKEEKEKRQYCREQ